MEFPFNVNAILPNQITKIKSNLLPEGFVGDRRGSQNCIEKISDILDRMGESSAKAQGLQRAVTSGEKMRNVDYTVYIFVEPEGNNGNGTVIGLLKVGRKNLFVFDASGAHKEVLPLCILDFYIHESKQRMGMGKILYDYMLQEESVLPIHLAIDRPSEKFMNFLLKHYGLKNILPQNNNFVVYDGFFENNPDMIQMGWKGHHYPEYPNNKSVAGMNATRVIEAAGSTNESPHFGRHAAYKRETTMGQIIQNVFPCGELKRVASDGIDPANLRDGEKACLSGSAPELQTGSPHHEQHDEQQQDEQQHEKRHERRHYEQHYEQHDEQQHEKRHNEQHNEQQHDEQQHDKQHNEQHDEQHNEQQHNEQQHDKRHERRHYEQHDEQQHEKQHYEQNGEQHDEQQHDKRHYEQHDEQHEEQQHEKRHYEQHDEQHNEQQHEKQHYEQHDEQHIEQQQDKRHYEQHNEQQHSQLW